MQVPHEVKIHVHQLRRHPKIKINGQILISKWEVVLGVPDGLNIPCLMHDPHAYISIGNFELKK